MKLKFCIALSGLLALVACSSSRTQPIATATPQAQNGGPTRSASTPAGDNISPQHLGQTDTADQVVAMVRGDAITHKDLDPLLEQGYGLNLLLTLVQRDLVRQEAAKAHVVISPQDIANEQQLTLIALKKSAERVDPVTGATSQPSEGDISPEEAAQLLNKILEDNHVSQGEFNVVIEINTYLRKIAQPQVSAQLTEDAVRRHFNAMYGEKVLVHYIVCDNMIDAAQVRRDLGVGNTFEDVARQRSKDWRTAAAGGELPAFTAQDNRFPEEFKQVAFLLKKGEISDDIQIGKFVYIVKLIDRIPPEHARFEDYKETVRKDLYEQAVQAAITAMRQNLGKMALDSMHIQDPGLKLQWEQRLAAKNNQPNADAMRRQMDQERNLAGPSTRPLQQYINGGADLHPTTRADYLGPALPESGAAPPATMPAAPATR